MPIPMTAQQFADLSDPTIPKDVVWCLSIAADEGVLAINNRSTSVDYLGVTYEAGAGKWQIEGDLTNGENLVAETMAISFDASEQYDPASFIARLLASSYSQREANLFLLIYNAETGAFIVQTRQYVARVDDMEVIDQSGNPARALMACETGTYQTVGRRRTLCSDADQRRRLSTDAFFKNVGVKGSQQVPFGISWSKVPGANGASSGSVGVVGFSFGSFG